MFFFFSGHGDSAPAPGRDWNTDGRDVETICPYDITVLKVNAKDASPAVDLHMNSGPRVEADESRTPPPADLPPSSRVAGHTHGIPDRTFGALMRGLAQKKGDNIVRIDCFIQVVRPELTLNGSRSQFSTAVIRVALRGTSLQLHHA